MIKFDLLCITELAQIGEKPHFFADFHTTIAKGIEAKTNVDRDYNMELYAKVCIIIHTII